MSGSSSEENLSYYFGSFRLDAGERQLIYDGRPVALTPKAFDLLLILVENSGRLISKERLMQLVWPDTFVEEMNLSRHVSTVRKILEECDPRSPFIETVPKRGYRFLVPVRQQGEVGADPSAALAQQPVEGPLADTESALGLHLRHTVGREGERAKLRKGFESAASGRGLIYCVTGEPGIGKTTLVEDFLAELTDTSDCIIARGRCSERLAGSEAYLPFLEALENLVRSDSGGTAARLLKQTAPTWHVHISPAVAGVSTGSLVAEARTASQQWMKRELSAFFQALSAYHPLVLFLDDIHWSDISTVDLLAYLAGKLDVIRILIITPYRPSELMLEKHPFLPVKLDLQARGACREIALPFLSRDEIERYLALEFPDHDLPAELPDLIHAKTEGSPLFMVDLIRYLRDRRVIAQESEQWRLVQPLPDVERDLPESVRGMIQRKFEQLGDDDRRLLVTASVQGNEFDTAVLATVLRVPPTEVEERLERMERVHSLVRLDEETELPDGTLTLRFQFVHRLYRNAMYASLGPTLKAELHRALADTLIHLHQGQISEIASRLAVLFRDARDNERAAEYYLLASQNAMEVFANLEAIQFCQNALEMLDPLLHKASYPSERITSLVVQTYEQLGEMLAITGRHEEARDCYDNALTILPGDERLTRARLQRRAGKTLQTQRQSAEALAAYDLAEATLGAEPGDSSCEWRQEWIFIQLERLWEFYWQGRVDDMRDLVARTRPHVEDCGSRVQRGKFFNMMALYHLRRDRYVTSDEAMGFALAAQEAIKGTDDVGEIINISFSVGFACLWRGDLDKAQEKLQEVRKLARRRGNLEHQVLSLTYLTIIHRKRGELIETRAYNSQSREVAAANQMAPYIAMAKANQAWLAWRDGNYAEAEEQGRQALQEWQAQYPFQWAALWPLIGISLALGRDDRAIEYAHQLLAPTQQRLPEEVEAAVAIATRVWEEGRIEAARSTLIRALQKAEEANYL